jgi:hypothetical protein
MRNYLVIQIYVILTDWQEEYTLATGKEKGRANLSNDRFGRVFGWWILTAKDSMAEDHF